MLCKKCKDKLNQYIISNKITLPPLQIFPFYMQVAEIANLRLLFILSRFEKQKFLNTDVFEKAD